MAATPRSPSAATGRPMPSGAISPSTRFRRRATARSTTMSAGSPISRRGACASSAIPGSASRKITCAFCASSVSTPPTAPRSSRRRGLAACIAGRDGLDQLSRERVRMEMMKLLVAPHAVPTLIAMTDAGLTLRMLGGVSYLGSFENMAKVEAAIGAAADPVRRLGALGVWVAEDAERLWQKLRLTNAEHERLISMAEGWRRISPASASRPRARALPAQPGTVHRPRAARLGALASERATTRLGRRWRLCRALDCTGVSVRRPRILSRAASRKARRWARRSRGGKSLDRGGVSGRQAALDKIADAAVQK